MSLADSEFDIVFAGGGAAACVTAGRLAAADPSLKILMLEAGPHVLNQPAHVQPALFMSHMVPDSRSMKFLVSNPSPHLGGRCTVVPAGQCMGGGSSVNFTVYNRAAPSEFDDWETKFNNPGWGYKDILPMLKNTEAYDVGPPGDTHGSAGPLAISLGGHFPNVSRDFLDVAAKYDKSREVRADGTIPFSVNTYGRWPKWISAKTGRRSDAAHHFVYTQGSNPNFCVLTGQYVKRVIIQNGRAVGVEYVPNPQLHPDAPSKPASVFARKWVVVCGGSLGSPLILERSGIGSASVLEKVGIKQIVDLPGVGERYQDHQILIALSRASDESETLDGIMRGERGELNKWSAQWTTSGSGLMATNGLDAGVKLRPTEADLKTIGPAFEARWKSYYASAPDRSTMWIGCASFCFGAIDTAPPGKYFGVGSCLNHPSSLGHIHITSGEDPQAPPDFTPGYLEHEDDMAQHVFAYKYCRELVRRMSCFRGEYPPRHPKFANNSPAAVHETSTPVAIDAPNIEYNQEDDEAIRNFVRNTVCTSWHALGTCAMMPREQGGVVDPRLNVYGVKSLKVVDLSIAPLNVGANTYSTVCAIAEKAAVILGEDMGLHSQVQAKL